MPDAPTPRRPAKGLVLILLVFQILGTAALVSYSFYEFMEHEDRGDGLTYLSLGILWFLLVGWRVRMILHPRPA